MNTLAVITGPTASGKTGLAIEVAEALACDIISADSRQMFRDIPVATAAPSPEQLARVTHHFVGNLALTDYYSAARYEEEVLNLLPSLFEKGGGVAVMCGGSMMYIDAVVNGIDILPTISPQVRESTLNLYHSQGLDEVRRQLSLLDPDYAKIVDPANHRRIIHALEICLEAGVPYSSLRTGTRKPRPFRVIKIALNPPREELFARINARVELMALNGLLDEAKKVYPLRHLNSLNTVGLKEMFAFIDGNFTWREALDRMAKNTRVYAKKQLTWLKRDPSTIFLPDPSPSKIISILNSPQHHFPH